MADLTAGMLLEGVVTNVAGFGAFVDVGVHQDGLVHVSAMSRSFVSDPRDVVRPGDVVRVRVLSVDVPRKRIALSLLLEDDAAAGRSPGRPPQPAGGDRGPGGPRRGGRPGGQRPEGAGGKDGTDSKGGKGTKGATGTEPAAPGGAVADAPPARRVPAELSSGEDLTCHHMRWIWFVPS